MRLSCKFRFHIGILNQHWLVEQGRRPMADWPATVAPKWAPGRNHAATVEEDAIREAAVVPTGGQAGRWQAITDTTTTFRYCLWIARGLYPDYIIPSLPEQTQKLLKD